MNHVIKITAIDRIKRLYSVHDEACDTNVVSFAPPSNPNVTGLLDDVEVLLTDPQTREMTEDILRSALQHIAQQCLPT